MFFFSDILSLKGSLKLASRQNKACCIPRPQLRICCTCHCADWSDIPMTQVLFPEDMVTPSSSINWTVLIKKILLYLCRGGEWTTYVRGRSAWKLMLLFIHYIIYPEANVSSILPTLYLQRPCFINSSDLYFIASGLNHERYVLQRTPIHSQGRSIRKVDPSNLLVDSMTGLKDNQAFSHAGLLHKR